MESDFMINIESKTELTLVNSILHILTFYDGIVLFICSLNILT